MFPYAIMMIFTLLFAVLWQYTGVESNIVLHQGNSHKVQINRNLWFMLATFFPMFFINAFAYFSESRTDYQHYYTAFVRMSNSGAASSSDISYLLISKLVIALGLNFQFVYVICSFIGYSMLLLCVYKYSKDYAISYLLYFCSGLFFMLGPNQTRQFIAITIALTSYHYIVDGKFLKYCIIILIAASFHFTALIMIPAYFILKLRMKASYYLMVSLILLPCNIFYNQLTRFMIATFKPSYSNSVFLNRTFNPNMRLILGSLLIAFIILAYYTQIVESGSLNTLFANCVLISAVIYTLCGWIPEYHRIAYYFIIPMIFLIPNIMNIERNIYLRVLIVTVVGACWFFLYGYQAAFSASINNYKTIFSQ